MRTPPIPLGGLMVGVALFAVDSSLVVNLSSLTPFEVLFVAYPQLISLPMGHVLVFGSWLLWKGETREVGTQAFLRGFVIAGGMATILSEGFARLWKPTLLNFTIKWIDASPPTVIILGYKFQDAFGFLIPVVFVPSLFLVVQGLLALAGGLFLRRRVHRRAGE